MKINKRLGNKLTIIREFEFVKYFPWSVNIQKESQ